VIKYLQGFDSVRDVPIFGRRMHTVPRLPMPGLKRPNWDKDKHHRREIRYGIQCSREVLDHFYGYRRPYEMSPIESWSHEYFRPREYQRPLLDPLPIPGGRGEQLGISRFLAGGHVADLDVASQPWPVIEPYRSSSAVLATKHLSVDPIVIRRQQEANPFHPAKIYYPGMETDEQLLSLAADAYRRYRFAVPQVHVTDLADEAYPIEEKLLDLGKSYGRMVTGANVGKSVTSPLVPFALIQPFVTWLANSRVKQAKRQVGTK